MYLDIDHIFEKGGFAFIIVYIILSLGLAAGFGVLTLNINRKKHYSCGFWWGFLLGILGVIIVAVRSSQKKEKRVVETDSSKALKENEIEDIIDRMEAQSRQQKQSELNALLKKGKITEAEYRQRMSIL